jgi:hypothetical protein
MLDALTGGGGLPSGAGGPGPGPGGPPAPYNLDQGPPPTDQGPPSDSTGDYANSMEALDVAEDALHAFIQLDPDEIDRAQAGQALNVVLKLKASNQKSNQAGDGKSLMRALQQSGQGAPDMGGGGPPPGGGGPPDLSGLGG